MEVPVNETPAGLFSLYGGIITFISTYGWSIVFFLVVFNVMLTLLHPLYENWLRKKHEERIAEEYKRNPDILLAREEALQKSRQKLQEEHDEMAKQHAEKKKILDEQKRQEKIEKHERMLQGKSTMKPEENPNLRNSDYNPLTGSGGSCAYRPSRRTTGGGGGG